MFKTFLAKIWDQIKSGKFDFWEVLIPLFLKGAEELAKKAIDGATLNPTWKLTVRFAYYGTYLFYDVLVKNPDESWSDEAIKSMRNVFKNAALEGGFTDKLDIPDDMEEPTG